MCGTQVIFSDSVHNKLELDRALPNMLELTGAASAGGNCSTLLFHDVAQDMVWEQGGAMKSLSLLPEASQASCRRRWERGASPAGAVGCGHRATAGAAPSSG